MNTKKTKFKTKRVIVLISIILLTFIIIFLIARSFKKNNESDKPIEIVDRIDEYGYYLTENETSYYISLFNNLKKELNKEDIDEEAYAKLVAQLFVADFFNLDNKHSKIDVGGTQFIYEPFQGDFEKFAKESIYDNIESNIYNDRTQSLPIVKSVEIINFNNEKHSYLDSKDDNAYFVEIKINYEKDLDYQSEYELILVHNDKKLEIVELN